MFDLEKKFHIFSWCSEIKKYITGEVIGMICKAESCSFRKDTAVLRKQITYQVVRRRNWNDKEQLKCFYQ